MVLESSLIEENDYTINIALCKGSKPIFSVVSAPARNEIFHAEHNKGAFKNNERIYTKAIKKKNLNIVASKSHLNSETEDFIKGLQDSFDINFMQYGSSLKICKIAEGIADLYPRFGPTMEWDTCASNLILTESNGLIVDKHKLQLKYNKENLLNPNFIALNNENLLSLL